MLFEDTRLGSIIWCNVELNKSHGTECATAVEEERMWCCGWEIYVSRAKDILDGTKMILAFNVKTWIWMEQKRGENNVHQIMLIAGLNADCMCRRFGSPNQSDESRFLHAYIKHPSVSHILNYEFTAQQQKARKRELEGLVWTRRIDRWQPSDVIHGEFYTH